VIFTKLLHLDHWRLQMQVTSTIRSVLVCNL